MRLIAAIRLSRETDNTNSPETQHESIQDYADRHGHEIIAWTEDLDISGGVPIRQRPGVGRWLTQERLDQWDGIAGYVIDRMFRDHFDFVMFYHGFLKPAGKKLVVVGEHIDMSTDEGELAANMRVLFAQSELRRMQRRRREAAKRIREAGRWGGGIVPFGFRPEPVLGGWALVPDEEGTAPIVREMARRVIAGEPHASVAHWLNQEGVPTPRVKPGKHARRHVGREQYRWWPGSVSQLLRSRHLLGEIAHKKDPVRGRDGKLVKFEPVLDRDTWDDLQRALEGAHYNIRGRRGGHPLLGVAHCATCGRPLYQGVGNHGRRYYRCASFVLPRDERCGARYFPMDDLNADVNAMMIVMGQHFPVIEYVHHCGDDYSEQLRELGRELSDLTNEIYVKRRKGLDDLFAQKQAEFDRIAAEDPKPAWDEPVNTGRTMADEWAALGDMHERGKRLRQAGMILLCGRDQYGTIYSELAKETDELEFPRPWSALPPYLKRPTLEQIIAEG